jgi:hypothetical protein
MGVAIFDGDEWEDPKPLPFTDSLAADLTRVFISGPISKGPMAENVRNALEAANAVMGLQMVPFVPHLSHFWNMITPKAYQTWLAYDRQWLSVCDVVLRIPGESLGADMEVALAEELQIPVVYSVEELARWQARDFSWGMGDE